MHTALWSSTSLARKWYRYETLSQEEIERTRNRKTNSRWLWNWNDLFRISLDSVCSFRMASHYQNDYSALEIRNLHAAVYEYRTNNYYLVIDVNHKRKSYFFSPSNNNTSLDYTPIPDLLNSWYSPPTATYSKWAPSWVDFAGIAMRLSFWNDSTWGRRYVSITNQIKSNEGQF